MREQIAQEIYQSHGHRYNTGNTVPAYHHLLPEQHACLLVHADRILTLFAEQVVKLGKARCTHQPLPAPKFRKFSININCHACWDEFLALIESHD